MVALSLLPKPIVTIALWSCIALSDDSIKLAEFTLSGQKTIQRLRDSFLKAKPIWISFQAIVPFSVLVTLIVLLEVLP